MASRITFLGVAISEVVFRKSKGCYVPRWILLSARGELLKQHSTNFHSLRGHLWNVLPALRPAGARLEQFRLFGVGLI
jgi:hypothetical protein